MIVIGGSSSKGLAEHLASRLGAEYIQADVRRFPDGECYVRVRREEIDDDVVLVQNSYPDQAMVELFLLQEAVEGLGADTLTTVVPYYGYARQDRRFEPGEANSARAMARHIQLFSDRVITVDIHTPDILRWFDEAEGTNVEAAPSIGAFFRDKKIDTVLAPDEGAADRARKVASMMGANWDYLVKTRVNGKNVKMSPKDLEVEGDNVLIVDDIISTGGTISAANEELKKGGARRVVAACTHGLFAEGALERLMEECDDVVSTNTLEGRVSKISVAPQIAEVITGAD